MPGFSVIMNKSIQFMFVLIKFEIPCGYSDELYTFIAYTLLKGNQN